VTLNGRIIWGYFAEFDIGGELRHSCHWSYCKTSFFRMPFISRISRAWQVRENNRPRKFEYSSVSV